MRLEIDERREILRTIGARRWHIIVGHLLRHKKELVYSLMEGNKGKVIKVRGTENVENLI